MLVFIDFEHAEAHERAHGQRLLAARTTITYRMEDLSGRHCHLVRYNRVNRALLDRLDAAAILISGNSAAPDDYDPAELEPVEQLLRDTALPVFGFCGGLQLIARALGVDVVPLAAESGEALVTGPDRRPFEHGYHPIDFLAGREAHPLLAGLGPAPIFRHAHGLHLSRLPAGFDNLASTRATPIQLAVNDERRIVGTQFHPEYWTDEHPAGEMLIANFFRWSGIG